MSKVIKYPLLIGSFFIILAQSACSVLYTDDRPEVQYQRAYSAEQLEAPPDLSGIDRSAGFIVSGLDGGKIQRNTLLPSLDEVRFVREGDLGWLELSAPVEDVWPLVRKFILREGYLLKKDEPLLGYMETTWAEETIGVPRSGLRGLVDKTLEYIRASSSLTSYVIRFERVDNATSRLFVSQRTIEQERIDEGGKDDIAEISWGYAEHNPELEARILIRLMVFLGIDVQLAKGVLDETDVSLLESPAYIVSNENLDTSLFIARTLPLAWDEVETALENLYFTVDVNDIDAGRFEVSFAGAFFESKIVNEETEDSGWVDDFTGFFASSDDNVRGYQVYLSNRPGGTHLNVSDENGDPLSADEENALLNAIRLQLI